MSEIPNREQLEQEFIALSNDLESLYAQVPFGCHTLNADGIYLSINAPELAWLGIPLHAVIGSMRFSDHLSPESRDGFQEYFPIRIRNSYSEGLELEMIGANGAVRNIKLYMSAIRDSDGCLLHYRAVLYDITARTQTERVQHEADQRKDEFLAMLAHELRNPLVPIRNAAHILGKLQLEEPMIKWAQQVIETQVNFLSHMVDDLLDVSRFANGKITLKREAIELSALVRQIMQSITPLAEHKRHQLNVSLPEHEVWLNGDAVRLSQVFFNLLDNAVKYTPDGGCIEFSAHMSGNEIEIGVRDNGMGITADLLPKVFDLFQQDERGLDRAQGGLGIGLTLVQRLIAQHGGRLAAHSAGKGQGATFTIWLPVMARANTPVVTVTSGKNNAVTGTRVMVVDDDFAVADSTAMVLEIEGYTVRVADSGLAALAEFPLFRPQVVLLDIGLGGMDGFETAQRLRKLPEGRDVFVIAVTGYADEKTKARALASGCDDFLVKPVRYEVLAPLLEKMANGKTPAPSS